MREYLRNTPQRTLQRALLGVGKYTMEQNENNTQEENNVVQLKNTGQIELPKLDMRQYVGQEATIEEVTEHNGRHGYYVKATTGLVDTKGSEENPIEIRASKIFGLQKDEEGNIGWGKETKLGSFLRAMKVDHYNDLVGKGVIVTMRRTKDDKEFLTFE